MRVIQLEADGFKRLRAITITPTSNVVEVTGENGNGKSSALDAIWAALGGKDACPPKPIHTGKDKAEIRVILGEDNVPQFKVTRRFRLKEGVPYTTDLIVETAEGARFDKAQGVLDQMVGQFCFEPMTFLGMPDKDQIATLRRFVEGVDFDALAGLNKRDFDKRTEVGRTVRDLRGQLAGLPRLPDTIPPAEVDTHGLEEQLANAAKHNTEVTTRQANRDAAETRFQGHVDRSTGLRAQATALIEQAEEEEGLAAGLRSQIDKAEALPPLIDVVDVQQKLHEGRHTNALLAEVKNRNAIADRIHAAEAEVTALTDAIDQRKEKAAKAVRQAKMPIAGLGFGEDAKGDGFVTLNGEPLAQASMAQKIRAGVAIAAAMNPKLRVARIADGSLLDKKSWAALEEYAAEADLQIWIETVTKHGPNAVVIEDGAIAAAEVGDVL